MVSYSRSNILIGLAVAGSVLVMACGGSDGNGGTGPGTTGTISVTVTADGSPRAGVTVERFAVGSNTAVGTTQTNSNGVATFSNVDEGSWDVEITLPQDFGLAPGQTARKSVSVTAGATASTSFAIVDQFSGETIEATSSNTFSRPNITISAGTAVRWVNTSSMLHTVTPDGHTEWSSANLGSQGSSFSHTFNTPGTYDYFCQPHVGQGMTGTITVN